MTPEEELKKVLTDTGTTITALRKTIDELDAAGKVKDGEFKAFEKKANDRLDALDDKREKLEAQITAAKSAAMHQGANERKDIAGMRIEDPQVYDEAKKAFENFLRTGHNEGHSGHEQEKKAFSFRTKDGAKSASVLSDPGGGYTVMREFSAEVMRKVFETSPMLQECSVETVGTDRLAGIIDDNEASSGWVGEREARTETDTPEIGEWEIPVREVYAMPAVTQKQLDDSMWNYEQFLIDKAQDYIGRQINLATLLGATGKRPKGIMTYAAGTDFRSQIEQVNLLDANLITADGLIKIQETLKDFYRTGAKWFINRQTRRAIRSLKDLEGRYILEPGLQRGAPAEILGDPVVIFQDLADIAAGALPLIYGNMKYGYKVVERSGFRILRDPYTTKGYVLIYMTRRMGGAAWNKEAIKIGKIAA